MGLFFPNVTFSYPSLPAKWVIVINFLLGMPAVL